MWCCADAAGDVLRAADRGMSPAVCDCACGFAWQAMDQRHQWFAQDPQLSSCHTLTAATACLCLP
jgi:hypothetical protein